jgi:hypothetical protein
MDTNEILLYATPDSDTVSSVIPLISIALIDRVKKDDKIINIRFRRTGAKECSLRFEEPAGRDCDASLTQEDSVATVVAVHSFSSL